MIPYRIILLLILLPGGLFGQETDQAKIILDQILWQYQNTPAFRVEAQIDILIDDQLSQAHSLSAYSLLHGSNRRLDIREMVLIEYDTLHLYIDHSEETVTVAPRKRNTVLEEEILNSWLSEITDNRDAFLAASTFRETESNYEYTDSRDPAYEKIQYRFQKDNFLLSSIYMELAGEDQPYDACRVSYTTQALANTQQSDFGITDFIHWQKDNISLQAPYTHYTLTQLGSTPKTLDQ